MLRKIIFLYLTKCVFGKIQIFITDSPIVEFGGRAFKKELITDQYNSPKELAYDAMSRNLFFMYMDDELQNSGRAVVNVVTKKSFKINGIKNNKASAVNDKNGDVYFGSDDGLYKYDKTMNKANNIGLYNANILKLVVRNDEMFIIDANDHMLYEILAEGMGAVKIGDWKTVFDFEVDSQRNLHFVTMCGVYCAREGHETVKNKDLDIVYNFIVDGNQTFAVTLDSIYKINCENGTASEIAKLDFVPRSITVGDYGELYYSIDDSIFALRPINSYLIYKLHRKPRNTFEEIETARNIQ